MDTFTLLLKSAEQGHGRSLQPAQVAEVVQTMMAMDAQGRQLAGKIEALTRVVYCMLVSRDAVLIDDGTEDGQLVIPPFQMTSEFYEQQDYERGFDLDWDEDTGIITVSLGEPTESGPEDVGLSVLSDDELAAEGSAGSEPPVPEAAEGEGEAPEQGGDDTLGSVDGDNEGEAV